MLRLKIDDGLQSIVRQKITGGNFSRDAYDIAICLHYFGREYDLHQRAADKQILQTLLKDLKHMIIGDLRSNHLIYLLKGIGSCARGIAKDDETAAKQIREFIQPLIDSIDNDLHRYKIKAVIDNLKSFQEIAALDNSLVSRSQMEAVHRITSKYMGEYISQSKKEIIGS